MNHDTYCTHCSDRGVVATAYADDDGQEYAYCTRCQLGQELAEQFNDDVFAVEERKAS